MSPDLPVALIKTHLILMELYKDLIIVFVTVYNLVLVRITKLGR